jgi:hypothetical protein
MSFREARLEMLEEHRVLRLALANVETCANGTNTATKGARRHW